ncbi:MAG: hypothetical protein EBU49_01265 [Proteobacteria bacterium]|nr:hypothetical protein [Pseudomonadota bacterium]
MTKIKKQFKKQSVKPDKRPGKVTRRTVGGGSVDVPAPVLRAWQELSGIKDPAKATVNAAKFRQLWRIFTSGRERISPELLQDPGAAEAYITGFHLPNAARAALLCRRIAQRIGIAPGAKPGVGSGVRLGDWLGKYFNHQRIFDLGCGSGAWSQVWLSEVRLKRNAVHLIDASPALLEMAAKGIAHVRASMGQNASLYVETVAKEIGQIDFAQFDAQKNAQQPGTDAADKSLDVYILGYVWNELIDDRAGRNRILTRLDSCRTAKRNALLLLAEPATDEFAWDAMALRDQLCAAGWVAIYPCPTGARACPMLNAEGGVRDWCFSEGGWRKPEEYMKLEEDTGIAHNKINSAIFALASPELARQLPKMAPSLSEQSQVVVGKPSVPGGRPGREKGFSYLLCTPKGLVKTAPKRIEIKFAKPRGSTVSSTPKSELP